MSQRESMALKKAALQVVPNVTGDTHRRATDEIRAWPTWKLEYVSDVLCVSVSRIQTGHVVAKKKKPRASR